MAPSIFVNFRRADTGTTGPHLDTALQREFGKEEVFRDQRSIAKGAHFPDEIIGKLRKCDILLALMGDRWASVTDPTGRRCLDNEDDWVRREIALALELGLTVLPVLVDRAEMPDKDALPGDIQVLTTHQAVHFRPHHEDIDFPPLFKAIRDAVPALGPGRPNDTGKGNGSGPRDVTINRGSVTFDRGTANTFNFDSKGDQDDGART
ncbi:toll/interleukin-1 receptor domain-containing protein [Streptomyces sp. NPDC050997]|uniref:toll/interleukin-1 receptor domain-containing protein n=1 Tax=Streptomyces sp. NPDC050997 TaxID=3155519 RepID=UPI0034343647